MALMAFQQRSNSSGSNLSHGLVRRSIMREIANGDLSNSMTLNLLVDLELELSVRWKRHPSGETFGTYKVVGPAARLNSLPMAARRKLRGFLSPLAAVTLPHEQRDACGVPADAATYAFAHAAHGLETRAPPIVDDSSLWRFFVQLGGFVYFSKRGELLRVNALSLLPSEEGSRRFELPLDGPHALSPHALDALRAQSRVRSVQMLAQKSMGFDKFAWATPDERPGGHELGETPTPHGAFVYEMSGREPVYYALRPSVRAAMGVVAVGDGSVDDGGTEEDRACLAPAPPSASAASRGLRSVGDVLRAEFEAYQQQMAFIREHFGRPGASVYRTSLLLELWPCVAALAAVLAVLLIAAADGMAYEVCGTFLWEGLLVYITWLPVSDATSTLSRSRQSAFRMILLAVAPVATVCYSVLRYAHARPSPLLLHLPATISHGLAFLGVGLLLPLLLFWLRRREAGEVTSAIHAARSGRPPPSCSSTSGASLQEESSLTPGARVMRRSATRNPAAVTTAAGLMAEDSLLRSNAYEDDVALLRTSFRAKDALVYAAQLKRTLSATEGSMRRLDCLLQRTSFCDTDGPPHTSSPRDVKVAVTDVDEGEAVPRAASVSHTADHSASLLKGRPIQPLRKPAELCVSVGTSGRIDSARCDAPLESAQVRPPAAPGLPITPGAISSLWRHGRCPKRRFLRAYWPSGKTSVGVAPKPLDTPLVTHLRTLGLLTIGCQRWLDRTHKRADLKLRRQRLRSFSTPIFCCSIVNLVGNLLGDNLAATGTYDTHNLSTWLWVVLLCPCLAVCVADLNSKEPPRFSLTHAIFFISVLYPVAYRAVDFDNWVWQALQGVTGNLMGIADLTSVVVMLIHIALFTVILTTAKLALYFVAAPNTRPEYLFPFQFFDFIFAYAFFGLRSATSDATSSEWLVWVSVQLLVQVNVFLRNSGTVEALTRRSLRWLGHQCALFQGKGSELSNYQVDHDPIFRLQFLARLGIQSDLADRSALLLTPCLVSAFVWRDGRFDLEGTGVIVLPGDVRNVWARFLVLFAIRPAFSFCARVWLDRNMGRVLTCRHTLHGRSPLGLELHSGATQLGIRSKAAFANLVDEKLRDLRNRLNLTNSEFAVVRRELSLHHLEYRQCAVSMFKRNTVFYVAVIVFQTFAAFPLHRTIAAADLMNEPNASAQYSNITVVVPPQLRWISVPFHATNSSMIGE